jgi:hypothetical protein
MLLNLPNQMVGFSHHLIMSGNFFPHSQETYYKKILVAKIRVDKIKLLTNLDTNEKVYYIYEVKILEPFKVKE